MKEEGTIFGGGGWGGGGGGGGGGWGGGGGGGGGAYCQHRTKNEGRKKEVYPKKKVKKKLKLPPAHPKNLSAKKQQKQRSLFTLAIPERNKEKPTSTLQALKKNTRHADVRKKK